MSNAHDIRDHRCTTCRGWSCLACVEGSEHDYCALDCPRCYGQTRHDDAWPSRLEMETLEDAIVADRAITRYCDLVLGDFLRDDLPRLAVG